MCNLKDYLLTILKGTVIALLLSLIFVLIFAFIIQAFSLPMSAIKPVNVVLKMIAVFVGVFFSVKEDKGLVKGLLTGIVIIFFAFLLFGLLGKNLYFTWSLVWELLLGGAIGSVAGILSVGFRR